MSNELSQNRGSEELYLFLARRVALYTGIDHSSLPKDLAQELFESTAFTLEQGAGAPGNSLNAQFAAGLAVTKRKLEYGRKLWQAVRDGLPKIENLSLRETVKSIGFFWRRYDCRFFAHQIPCDIDYQLCRPVPETLQGVDYVNRYLSQLYVENEFLGHFDPQGAIAVLRAYCGDYRGLLINLYEPVATNALGLALIGGDVSALDISPRQREEIGEVLRREGAERLGGAAEKLCTLLNIQSKAGREYLSGLATDLIPRIRQTDLEGIFLTCA